MNLDRIKELVKQLRNENYKDLFAALILYEEIDYIHELEDVNEKDIEFLEKIYKKFMDKDYITSLINQDILDLMEEE